MLAIVSRYPQMRRLRQPREAAGLSLEWATLGATNEVGWSVYTLQAELWLAVPMPIVMTGWNVALVGTMAGMGLRPARSVAVAAAWAGTLIVVTMVGGFASLGALLGLLRRAMRARDLVHLPPFGAERHRPGDVGDHLGRGVAVGLVRLDPPRRGHRDVRRRRDTGIVGGSDPLVHHAASMQERFLRIALIRKAAPRT
jgi:hypothetical protein